jgi:hypothetical protein
MEHSNREIRVAVLKPGIFDEEIRIKSIGRQLEVSVQSLPIRSNH